MTSNDELVPLRELLDSILARLGAVESKLGITPATITGVSRSSGGAEATTSSPSLDAFDSHVTNAVLPLASACDALDGLQKAEIGTNLTRAWGGIRTIVALASRCEKPSGDWRGALAPHLKETQDSISQIRQVRLDRSYDTHQRALMEMLASLSWILVAPPPQSPTLFVKDTLGATEFWSNKIRKQYKGADTEEGKKHIEFCDKLKCVILDLSSYIKEYHLSGLCWNPRGIPFEKGEEALLTAEVGERSTPSSASGKDTSSSGDSRGGGIGAIMSELSEKQTTDGSSAATGLRKVTKEQQTWRKEYGANKSSASVPATSASAVKPRISTRAMAPSQKPVLIFEDRGNKWRVEYQNKDTNPGGSLKIQIKDAKEQVYIYKCQNTTVEITGKLKSIIVDDCVKVNVVFGTAISSCEVVNSKSVQLQTLGVCPSFTIDKTDGCLVYLSKETIPVTTFVASKSSEMNVCWPDESGEIKEMPIPEQFMHTLVDGSIKSEVSDLYH